MISHDFKDKLISLLIFFGWGIFYFVGIGVVMWTVKFWEAILK